MFLQDKEGVEGTRSSGKHVSIRQTISCPAEFHLLDWNVSDRIKLRDFFKVHTAILCYFRAMAIAHVNVEEPCGALVQKSERVLVRIVSLQN